MPEAAAVGHSGSSLQLPHPPCSAPENNHDYEQSHQNISNVYSESVSHSVISDSLQPHGL